MRATSPTFTLTMSFSLTLTRASMLLRSAMRMTSVPANWLVPTTRSPRRLVSELMEPSVGATMVVFDSA